MKSVFVDSSVLFSATNSPTGGSSKLFSLAEYKFVTSTYVLTEVERNIRRKLHDYHIKRFLLLASLLEIIEYIPVLSDLKKAEEVIAKKDAIILAQAKYQKAHFLVTLDKKDFINSRVSKYFSPGRIVMPKDLFLEK